MYEDKTLVCKDCGAEFVFTAGEQEFYAEKGFVNEPKRCKSCRDAKKNASGNKPEREMFTATCAACGKEARVPFQPREDRAVYCSECFAKMLNKHISNIRGNGIANPLCLALACIKKSVSDKLIIC